MEMEMESSEANDFFTVTVINVSVGLNGLLQADVPALCSCHEYSRSWVAPANRLSSLSNDH